MSLVDITQLSCVSILLAIALLTLISIEILFAETLKTFLALLDLMWVQALHARVNGSIVKFLNIATSDHMEEGVLCEAVIDDFRLLLLFK